MFNMQIHILDFYNNIDKNIIKFICILCNKQKAINTALLTC